MVIHGSLHDPLPFATTFKVKGIHPDGIENVAELLFASSPVLNLYPAGNGVLLPPGKMFRQNPIRFHLFPDWRHAEKPLTKGFLNSL